MTFINFEDMAQKALDMAQFGFKLKPISVNAAYIPVVHRATYRADVRLSAAAESYKKQIITHLWAQKKLANWECLERKFSMWIIADHSCRCDIDNIHKLIQDAFVTAGVVPDDRHARDCRQMFADMSKSKRMPAGTKFAVLIRWGDLI